MSEFRVHFDPQVESKFEPFIGDPVINIKVAEDQLNMIAMYTLHLHETSIMPDYSNYGYIEVKGDDGVWSEYNDM